MSGVKTGGKVCEEDTLQTAFKKLRVDAESSVTAVHVCEPLAPRVGPRINTDGAKPKITSPKENWHGCTRKSSRGLARNQRRRRSKSPILHPPKFTYCSSIMPSPPSHLKHKNPSEPDSSSASLPAPAKNELLFASPCTPVFGASGCEARLLPSPDNLGSLLLYTRISSDEENSSESWPRTGRDKAVAPSEESSASGIAAAATKTAAPSDFRSLSELREGSGCSCSQKECQCSKWQGLEVYSFTGLRNVIKECEKETADSPHSTPQSSRTQSGSGGTGSSPATATATTTSPRSCSEQARAYMDDIAIEDLSGYMEYYLYIPKMSHMAEMMYT